MGDQILHFDEAHTLSLEVTANVRVPDADGRDAVDEEGHPVTERRRWVLRDDIPAEALFGLFRLLGEGAEALGDGAETADANGFLVAAARFETEQRVYLDALTRIFQHSYPRVTAEELARWFHHRQRKDIVEAFFSLLGVTSSTPAPTPPGDTAISPASTATSTTRTATMSATASPTGAMGQTATAPNRATRRAGARKAG